MGSEMCIRDRYRSYHEVTESIENLKMTASIIAHKIKTFKQNHERQIQNKQFINNTREFYNKLTDENVTEKQLSSSEKLQIHVYWKHLWQKRPVVQSNWHKN